jgi:hypothetical protein
MGVLGGGGGANNKKVAKREYKIKIN